jgi:hypothetical protein
VSLWSKVKRAWLVHVAKPVGETFVYRAACDRPVRRVMEIGVGTGERTLKLIKLLSEMTPATELAYFGVDLFEGREMSGQAPGQSLKEMHRLLKTTGCRVQLIPGDPFGALARTANTIQQLELIVINQEQQGESLDRAWFYLPRMLAPGARIIVEDTTIKEGFRILSATELQARSTPVRRRAA